MPIKLYEKIVSLAEKLNKKHNLGLDEEIAEIKELIELHKSIESEE